MVTWDNVPDGKRQGKIQKYKVNYTAATKKNETLYQEVKAPTQRLQIVGLEENTNYTITVSASTIKGYGPASKPVVVAAER